MINDKSHADYISLLFAQMREAMAVAGAVQMKQCLVCKTYAYPNNHKCYPNERLAIG